MRKFFNLLFFSLLIALALWQKDRLISNFNSLWQSRCQKQVAYKIGIVDQDFKISPQTFLTQAKKAAAIWEKAYGQKLFVYDEQAEMAVNLIYSESQSALEKVENQQGKLDSGKISLDAIVAAYRGLTKDFESRLESFNREVALWNSQGGAPVEVYEELVRQQEALKSEADRLNDMAAKLNLSVKDYNFQVGEFNQSVKNYNQVLKEKPEAGFYDGLIPEIDIYITLNDQELIHTLAHELGHALGLAHLDNPQSIMYAFTSETTDVSSDDAEAIKSFCEEKVYQVYFRLLKEKINNNISF